MAKVVITLKIMPESPEINLEKIQTEALAKITEYAGEGDTKIEQEPLAFGLKAIKIMFVMDEDKGATDPLEEQLQKIEGIKSVEITDVRRAIG